MRKLSSLTALAILLLALFHGAPASAQSASPETMAAARELIAAMRAADQFKSIIPVLMQQLRPAIVQGRPEVERDYDTMVPVMLEIFNTRSGAVLGKTVTVTPARNSSPFSPRWWPISRRAKSSTSLPTIFRRIRPPGSSNSCKLIPNVHMHYTPT